MSRIATEWAVPDDLVRQRYEAAVERVGYWRERCQQLEARVSALERSIMMLSKLASDHTRVS